MTAHAVAIGRPDRDPWMLGDAYRPPSQPSKTNVWYRRSAFEACTITDEPFGAYPSLCTSIDIDITPGTRKSQGGTVSPFSSMNGRMNPPMHASTCIHAS